MPDNASSAPDYAAAARELATVVDFARWLTTVFARSDLHYGHGTVDPWDEALALIAGALRLPWDRLERLFPARLTDAERRVMVALARRRIEERVPVPYLTGRAWFAGVEFSVDQRVLIPRSPIAEMILVGFEPWLQAPPKRILDLCTGSGAIGIACALAFLEAEVLLADISADALAVAKANVDRYQLDPRVMVRLGDLFVASEGRFDLIVSNPPYVPSSSYAQLPAEYGHEPALALVADDEGVAIVERILCEAADHLTEQGVLILEVGEIEPAVVQRLGDATVAWPEFSRGGEGVLVADATTLRAYAAKRAAAGGRPRGN